MHVEVLNEDGTTWTKIENKEEVEIHLIDRNVELRKDNHRRHRPR
jgi:hypothetical protein